MLARLDEHDDTPVEDHIVVLRGMKWSDYERMLKVRGEAPVPRFAYLEGELEIMTPSMPHESIKSWIGRLVEVWCLEHDIEFSPVGSWTLKKRRAKAGLEPDECYVFGQVKGAKRPDLAIEVVWTSGGIDKLAIYARLGVPEVWFWRRGKLRIHVLRGDAYVESAKSKLLPGIDLPQLCSYLDRDSASQAMREYRAALTRRSK
ncbi:MAG TPA: Uma2 family endonuclease [Polyangiaceae bacterium]|nr:Uma2 family endonuclease [Polyangiaceae bacterium]